MKLARVGVMVALLAIGGTASAHDFWIEADDYALAPDETAKLRFLVGDGPDREDWALLTRKIVALRDYGPGRVTDLQASVIPSEDSRPGSASAAAGETGTHIIALETTEAASDLAADAFNAYALHEGLTAVLAHRHATGKQAANGREVYSRRAKLLLQVGNLLTDNVVQPIGQTLEIVPDVHPMTLPSGASLRVRIFYRGRPLAGAQVRLVRIGQAEGHGIAATTDADGRASFRIGEAGTWRIATVWSVPVDLPTADYQTIFSSLTFEVS